MSPAEYAAAREAHRARVREAFGTARLDALTNAAGIAAACPRGHQLPHLILDALRSVDSWDEITEIVAALAAGIEDAE